MNEKRQVEIEGRNNFVWGVFSKETGKLVLGDNGDWPCVWTKRKDTRAWWNYSPKLHFIQKVYLTVEEK